MNIIEDTHITLIGIPFKKEANSLLLFVITNIREKVCRVSIPVHIYNSLVHSITLLKLPTLVQEKTTQNISHRLIFLNVTQPSTYFS